MGRNNMREGSGDRGDWGLLEKQKKGRWGAQSTAEEASKRGGETSLSI